MIDAVKQCEVNLLQSIHSHKTLLNSLDAEYLLAT